MNWDIRIDIYTLTCVKWQALQHRELSLVLCDDLDGRAGRRQWKGGSRARGYIYIQLIHFTVWQKPTQHFKATIFQFKEVTFSARFPSSIYLLVTQLCLTLSTSWTIACQAALFMEFSRQEYWSGYQFLLEGIFLTQSSNLVLLHCRLILYHLSHQGRWHQW